MRSSEGMGVFFSVYSAAFTGIRVLAHICTTWAWVYIYIYIQICINLRRKLFILHTQANHPPLRPHIPNQQSTSSSTPKQHSGLCRCAQLCTAAHNPLPFSYNTRLMTHSMRVFACACVCGFVGGWVCVHTYIYVQSLSRLERGFA